MHWAESLQVNHNKIIVHDTFWLYVCMYTLLSHVQKNHVGYKSTVCIKEVLNPKM